MDSTGRGSLVAKNAEGRLECLKASMGTGSYIGSRTLPDGREDTRRFRGAKEDVIARWQRWQNQTRHMDVPRDRKVEDTMATTQPAAAKATTPAAAKMPERMYVLQYVFGKTVKDIAVYADMNRALDMAIALKAALDATDQDGDYTAAELPVWD